MLTQYRICLQPDAACRPQAEWAYRLYTAMLEQTPRGFGESVHRDAVTPVSQYLSVRQDGELLWTVSLLGEDAERTLIPVLEQTEQYVLKKDRVTLAVRSAQRRTVGDTDELFSLVAAHGGPHQLSFRTATAFKSRGAYLNLPTARLILQSLVKKWNGCITDCPIEDEDGEGVETIARGLRIKEFRLSDRMYHLKGNAVPGFVGEITVENRLAGFHAQLADALLLFSGFSGVGIKTTLGMGGVEHR